MDSKTLHETLWSAGAAFEEAGIYSQAIRYYKYLDSAWDKYPPKDTGRQTLLKNMIAAISTKQDLVRMDVDAPGDHDSLMLYQKVYRPGQTLLCTVRPQELGSVWLVLRAEGKEGQGEQKEGQMPVLFAAQALAGPLSLKLPETPGNYSLSVYDGNGRFLTEGQVTILSAPIWAGSLKVESEGYPGFGGIPVPPATEFTCMVHNKPEWVKGIKKQKIWVGLFRNQDPLSGQRPITSWNIRQKEPFTPIKATIKEPGAYQFRLISEEGKEKQLLLTADVVVGELVPVQRFADVDKDAPPLVFQAKQKIKIANAGLVGGLIRGMDPRCLLVPSWFAPADIQHGLNHALAVNTDLQRGDGAQMEVPDSGGEYDILYYPHWLALTEKPASFRLGRVRVEESIPAGLVLPQAVFSPGSNIRVAARFGALADNLRLYLLPEENLQVRADKAGYVSDKRYSASLDAKSCPERWCWLDITAPLVPGKYILAAYNGKQLVAAQPVGVEKRRRSGAEIIVSPGTYQAGRPFRFKVFPPAEGMASAGRVGLFRGDQEVKKINLSPRYMDFPVSFEAPKEPGVYELRFFLPNSTQKTQQTPVDQVQVAFVDGANMPKPDFDAAPSALSPEALAVFQRDNVLSGSDLAQFTLFNPEVAPGQEVYISYTIPQGLPVCVVMVPHGQNPGSLAEAMQGAVKVQELNFNDNVLTLRAPKSGDWDLCFYDTLQWAKAGAPRLLATRSLRVLEEGAERKLEYPRTAFAKGDFVLRLRTSPGQELSKAERTVRLFAENVNTIRNESAAVATATFDPIISGVYQAKLALNLEPGQYSLKIGDDPTTSAVHVVANPDPPKTAALRLIEKELILQGLVTVEFSPASQWEKGWAWTLAAKDGAGTFQFINPPRIIKAGGDRVSRIAFTLPRDMGEYRVCMWENGGSVNFAKLPASAVILPLTLRLPQAYERAHQPKVELHAYFSTDNSLYAGMFTSGIYTASLAYDRSAWIGLLPALPSAAERTSETAKKMALWSIGLSGKDSGQWSFMAPEQPGEYQLVMYDGVKNGRLVYQRTIKLLVADMPMLERQAEVKADALLQSLPEYQEDIESIEESLRDSYKEQLEVPQIRPIPVSPKMLEQLQGNVQGAPAPHFAEQIMGLLSPAAACAAASTAKDCEADIDLAIENMRKVNINFGDGVNVGQVVGELAAKMASDLVMGEQHIAQAKQYYDKTKGYYEQAMQLKAGVEKDGWQETVEGALWNSTQAMLNSCVTDGCLSKLGRKAIEYKLKGYNPTKMTKDEQAAWKKEYTRMAVLLDPGDLRALETQTAKFADLAGQLSVPDAGTKAKEMAKATAVSTMKTVTLSMVAKMPGWAALKAYYETLNVLRGALIDKETVDFMDEYRKLRDEGGSIVQVNDVLSGKQVNYLMTSLRQRIENNPGGYLPYLSSDNRDLLKEGKSIHLGAKEIDAVVMGYMEQWYQQEVLDKRKDKQYQEMKDAWYASGCQLEAYKAEVAKKDFFGTMEELGGHITSSISGAVSGKKGYSSIPCARKALAFKNFLNLRGQIIEQMAGWQGGKDQACRLRSQQNNKLLDKLTCEALLSPATYKQTMAANAEACGALPKPLPPEASPQFKQLTEKGSRSIEVLLKVSGNTDILSCLCNRHSVMGSGCSYHPEPTSGASPVCDKPGPPCMQGNWGCMRLSPASDQASLAACGVAKAIREFRQKDNAKYQKWLQWRERYMQR
ncbi:MAG: hypothetical protein PHI97_15435 [Desulfobulbus sp.]|nr:hypothetical protein [Desulfobulbus sp.]